MSKSFWDHPIETIEKALHIRKEIESLHASLREIYGDVTQPLSVEKAAPSVRDGRKGKRSAATRAKMAASQKARWEKKKSSPAVKTPKRKRVVSAVSRKKPAAGKRGRHRQEKIAQELYLVTNKAPW
jgi:hypothetical protein